jgi:hypothetical protein
MGILQICVSHVGSSNRATTGANDIPIMSYVCVTPKMQRR